MTEETKQRLKIILEKELNRVATSDELANMVTDHNLLSRLAVDMAEEQVEINKTNQIKITKVENDIKTIKPI